jgi:tetratricopeptide (TPR) repeat protein
MIKPLKVIYDEPNHDKVYDLLLVGTEKYLYEENDEKVKETLRRVLKQSNYYKAVFRTSVLLKSRHKEIEANRLLKLAIELCCERILNEKNRKAEDAYFLLYMIGTNYERQERWFEAEEFYRRAIYLTKKHREVNGYAAYFALGLILFQLQKYQDASHMWKMAQNHVSETAYLSAVSKSICLYNIGRCYVELKLDEKAINYFDRALQLFPTFCQCYDERREIFMRQDNYFEVNQSFHTVLSIAKNGTYIAETMLDEADTYFSQGDFQQAHKLFLNIREKFPREYYPYCSIAYHLFQTGQADEALEQVENAIRVVRQDHYAIEELIHCMAELLSQLGPQYDEEADFYGQLSEDVELRAYLDRID